MYKTLTGILLSTSIAGASCATNPILQTPTGQAQATHQRAFNKGVDDGYHGFNHRREFYTSSQLGYKSDNEEIVLVMAALPNNLDIGLYMIVIDTGSKARVDIDQFLRDNKDPQRQLHFVERIGNGRRIDGEIDEAMNEFGTLDLSTPEGMAARIKYQTILQALSRLK
ncbi:MAG TPA: hypothetical protein VJJ52_04350 [Candidatus Nanoarchaeia archaeon]|nr:hypothetical protein [Candidatus Nanoarchaeia archaeon]